MVETPSALPRAVPPRSALRLLVLLALSAAEPIGLADRDLIRFCEGIETVTTDEVRSDLCALARASLIEIDIGAGEHWRARLTALGRSFVDGNARTIASLLLEPAGEVIDV